MDLRLTSALFRVAERNGVGAQVRVPGAGTRPSRTATRLGSLGDPLPFLAVTARFVRNIIVKTVRRGRPANPDVGALMRR